mgnify:CR=1 FL=1
MAFSDDLLDAFAADMVYLHQVGVHPVIVHGGGPQISRALEQRGIANEFRGGYRVTSTEAIPIVREVLREEISADLVERIGRYGIEARALNGFDEGLFRAIRRHAVVDGDRPVRQPSGVDVDERPFDEQVDGVSTGHRVAVTDGCPVSKRRYISIVVRMHSSRPVGGQYVQ